MGQNSSGEEIPKIKPIDDTGSDITFLQTIVNRRGSTIIKSKTKSHTVKKFKSKTSAKLTNKAKNDEQNKSIAEIIRDYKKRSSLKVQEKYLAKVQQEKNKIDLNSETGKVEKVSTKPTIPPPSFTISPNSLIEYTKKTTIQVKRPKIDTFYVSPNFSLCSSKTAEVKIQKEEENTENKKKDKTCEIKGPISATKNKREVINQLFEKLKLSSEKVKGIERGLSQREKKIRSLNTFHANTVCIEPTSNFKMREKSKKSDQKVDHEDDDKSVKQLNKLTKQHLMNYNPHYNEDDKKKELVSNNTEKNYINEFPYQQQKQFRKLISELRSKIKPRKISAAEVSKSNLTSSTSISSPVRGISDIESMKNFSHRDVYHGRNYQHHITDANCNKDRFRTHISNEFVEPSPRPYKRKKEGVSTQPTIRERMPIPVKTIEIATRKERPKHVVEDSSKNIQLSPQTNVKISCYKYDSEKDSSQDQGLITASSRPSINQVIYKRYRSVNDQPRIYYYMKKPIEDNMSDTSRENCETNPLPKIPERINSKKSARTPVTSLNKRIQWIQDDCNNWHKISSSVNKFT